MPRRRRAKDPASDQAPKRARTSGPTGRNYKPDDPATRKYKDATESLKQNTFINNPALSEHDRIYLRGIQGTWHVRERHETAARRGFEIMLIWDYDRIWGSFRIGSYTGILIVDHGPRREPPELAAREDQDEDEESQEEDGAEDVGAAPKGPYFDFTWRATTTDRPDAICNNPLVTKGKILFGTVDIHGYFEGMSRRRFDFVGTSQRGPRRVPRGLQSFIDDWNELGLLDEEETARLPPAAGVDTGSSSATPAASDEEESDNESGDEGDEVDSEEDEDEDEDEEDEDEEQNEEVVLRSASGLYKISSTDIMEEWPKKANDLELRIHVDNGGNKIWGWFDMGICEGFLSVQSIPARLSPGVALKFNYRGREAETGKTVRGTGKFVFKKNLCIRGSFQGMYGSSVEFDGKRAPMPRGISGRDVSYYRNGWMEYGQDMNRWGR